MKEKEKLGTPISRTVMKNIVGGYEDPHWDCTFYWTDGTTTHQSIPANNGTAAQCAADYICWNNNYCTNADCVNSGPCE